MRVPRSSLAGLDRDYGAMTPMIDVVFNLLIFFVIGAGAFTSEKLLATNLSATHGTSAVGALAEAKPWAVTVTLKLFIDPAVGRCVVDMNGATYDDREKLKEQLRALAEVGPENPIILDIAANVPLADMIDVYDTCRAAGFESINFAARAKSP